MIAQLIAIGTVRQQPRNAVVRDALEQFIEAENRATMDQAFGSWKNQKDGLALQRELRDEWS